MLHLYSVFHPTRLPLVYSEICSQVNWCLWLCWIQSEILNLQAKCHISNDDLIQLLFERESLCILNSPTEVWDPGIVSPIQILFHCALIQSHVFIVDVQQLFTCSKVLFLLINHSLDLSSNHAPIQTSISLYSTTRRCKIAHQQQLKSTLHQINLQVSSLSKNGIPRTCKAHFM